MPDGKLVAQVILELEAASVARVKSEISSAVASAMSGANVDPKTNATARLLTNMQKLAEATAKAEKAFGSLEKSGGTFSAEKAAENTKKALEASADAAKAMANAFKGQNADFLKGIDKDAVSAAIALERLAQAEIQTQIAQQRLSGMQRSAELKEEAAAAKQAAAAEKEAAASSAERAAAIAKLSKEIQQNNDWLNAYNKAQAGQFSTGFALGSNPLAFAKTAITNGLSSGIGNISAAFEAGGIKSALSASMQAGASGLSESLAGAAGSAGMIGAGIGVAVVALGAAVDLAKKFADALREGYDVGRELSLSQLRLQRILGTNAQDSAVMQGLLAATGNAGNVFSTITLNQIQSMMAQSQLIASGAMKPNRQYEQFAISLSEAGINPTDIGTKMKNIVDVIGYMSSYYDTLKDQPLKRSMVTQQFAGLFGQDFANIIGLGKDFVTGIMAISNVSKDVADANQKAANSVLASSAMRERAEAELSQVIFRAGAPLEAALNNLIANISLGAAKMFGDVEKAWTGFADSIGLGKQGAGSGDRQLGFMALPYIGPALYQLSELSRTGKEELDKRKADAAASISVYSGGTNQTATGVVSMADFRKTVGSQFASRVNPDDAAKAAINEYSAVVDEFVTRGLKGVTADVMKNFKSMTPVQIAAQLKLIPGANIFGDAELQNAANAISKEIEARGILGQYQALADKQKLAADTLKELTKATNDYDAAVKRRNASVMSTYQKEFDAVQAGTTAYESLFDAIYKSDKQTRDNQAKDGVSFAGGRSAKQVAADLVRLQNEERRLAAQAVDISNSKKVSETTKVNRDIRLQSAAELRKSLGIAPGEAINIDNVDRVSGKGGLTEKQKNALAAALEARQDAQLQIAKRIQDTIQKGGMAGLAINKEALADETGKTLQDAAGGILSAVDSVNLGSVDASISRKFSLADKILEGLAFDAGRLSGDAQAKALADIQKIQGDYANLIMAAGDMQSQIKLTPNMVITPNVLVDSGMIDKKVFEATKQEGTTVTQRGVTVAKYYDQMGAEGNQITGILENKALTSAQQLQAIIDAQLANIGLGAGGGTQDIVKNLSLKFSIDEEASVASARADLEAAIQKARDDVSGVVDITIDAKMNDDSVSAEANRVRQDLQASIDSLGGKVYDVVQTINVKYVVNVSPPNIPAPNVTAPPSTYTPPPPVPPPGVSGPSSVPGYASGGVVYPGTISWVGEKGPELFVPSMSGRILSAEQSIAAMRNSAMFAPPYQSAPRIQPSTITTSSYYYQPAVNLSITGVSEPRQVEKAAKRAAAFLSDTPIVQGRMAGWTGRR